MQNEKYIAKIKELMNIKSVGSGLNPFITISPKGDFVIYNSNKAGNSALYYNSVNDDTEEICLTDVNKSVKFGAISPCGNYFVYSQDDSGNELKDLYLLDIGKKEKIGKKITSVSAMTYDQSLTWSKDSRKINRSCTLGDKNYIEEIDIISLETNIVFEEPYAITSAQLSNCGNYYACTGYDANNFICIINKENTANKKIVKIENSRFNASPSWSKSDEFICFTTDANEYMQPALFYPKEDRLVFIDLDDCEEVVQFAKTSTPIYVSSDESKLYFLVSKNAETYIKEYDLSTKAQTKIKITDGVTQWFSYSEKSNKIAAINSSMNENGNAYIYDINYSSSFKLSHYDYEDLLSELAKPESVWIESYDGKMIQAWYLPAQSDGKNELPALINLHGGPTACSVNDWFTGVISQSLVLAGYSLLLPNYRGSTGFGKDFLMSNIGDVGGGDIKDVISCAEWLKKQSAVDANKIGVFGGSYGGYLTLFGLAKYPDTFYSGVSLVPVVDWNSVYEMGDASFKAYGRYLLGGTPEEKSDLYVDRSVLTHAKNIKSPLLVVATENDYRCPVEPIKELESIMAEGNSNNRFIFSKGGGHVGTFENQNSLLNLVLLTLGHFNEHL